MSSAQSGSPGSATDLVVDASIVVRLALADRLTALVKRRLPTPTLLWPETASLLRQLESRGEIARTDVDAALDRLGRARIDVHDPRGLIVAAVDCARRLGWAIYHGRAPQA